MAGGELRPITDEAITEAQKIQREFGPDENGLTRQLLLEIELRRAMLLEKDNAQN